MANYSDNIIVPSRVSPVDGWVMDQANISATARFSMLGRLQVQQQQNHALDFSSRSASPSLVDVPRTVRSETPAGGVVDLSTRGRVSISDEASNSSSSSNDKSGLILPALLQQEPLVPLTPQFNTLFKKSPSMTRPFKAYPKDPLNLPLGIVGGVTPAETMLNAASNEAYAEFRRQMLAQVVAAKARRVGSPSPPPDKSGDGIGHQPTQPEEAGSPQQPSSSATDPAVNGRDNAYWERRRKNNEAAKRSRDARRAKEDEIAIRAAFLEQENLKLKYEVAALRSETSRLRCLLYSN